MTSREPDLVLMPPFDMVTADSHRLSHTIVWSQIACTLPVSVDVGIIVCVNNVAAATPRTARC